MLLICRITRADWFQSVLQESVSCSTSQRATIYYNSTGCLDVALNVQTLLKHTTDSKIPILIPQHHKSIEIMLRIQPTYQAHLVFLEFWELQQWMTGERQEDTGSDRRTKCSAHGFYILQQCWFKQNRRLPSSSGDICEHCGVPRESQQSCWSLKGEDK